jgi:2-dehydro-3-deoxyglucarate aldolase
MLAREIKRTLREGGVSVGSWMSIGHVSIAEILAAAGYDWVVIETEHTAIDVSEALRLIIAVEAGGSVPLVRLASVDPVQTKAVMDSGAAGVLVPMVNSRADAETAVRSVKYPPQGFRGVGVARAQGYGASLDEYLRTANEDTLVVVQIEHIDAVNAIDDILAVPGIDATFIGPYDLSSSMGLPGQLDHPDVVAAMRRVLERTVAHGIAPGVHVVRAETAAADMRARLAEGYRFIAVGSDLFLLGHVVRSLHTQARAVAAERRAR